MTTPPRKCIAISAALLLASIFLGAAAHAAAPAGAVTHLDGILLVQKADGRTRVLSAGSVVEEGDTLLTDAESYARLRFAGGNDLTLAPDTQLAVATPASFALLRGTLRGSGRFSLKAFDTTVEARGGFVAELVPGPKATAFLPIRLAALDTGTMTDARDFFLAQNTPKPPAGAGLAPGLYVQVIDGIINLSNKGGSQSFAAGQFGYTASFVQPPVVVPANPGLKFTPPPAFSAPASQGSTSGAAKSSSVDCVVR